MKKLILSLLFFILAISAFSQPDIEDWVRKRISLISNYPEYWDHGDGFIKYLEGKSLINDVNYKEGCVWKRKTVLGGELCCPVKFEEVELVIDLSNNNVYFSNVFLPSELILPEMLPSEMRISINEFRDFSFRFYMNLLSIIKEKDSNFYSFQEISEIKFLERRSNPELISIYQYKVKYLRVVEYDCDFYGH
jgi:hypothetical protein